RRVLFRSTVPELTRLTSVIDRGAPGCAANSKASRSVNKIGAASTRGANPRASNTVADARFRRLVTITLRSGVAFGLSFCESHPNSNGLQWIPVHASFLRRSKNGSRELSHM